MPSSSFAPTRHRSAAAHGIASASRRWRAVVAGAVPGLFLATVMAAVALWASDRVGPLSAATVAVLLGLVSANLGVLPVAVGPGLALASRLLLRLGVVLLGLRLSLGDLAGIGLGGLLVVVATVAVTFVGGQWLGRRLGLSPSLSLLIATGYAICGVSAIAAMRTATDADDEEVALSMGLVTLFGSTAMFVLPVVAAALGLDNAAAGLWVGASVHDVAQVVATASSVGPAVLAPAVAVKLTRVAMLAPLVLAMSMLGPGRTDAADGGTGRMRQTVPWFVTGFLILVVIRSSGLVPDDVMAVGRNAERWLLTTALVGLGAGIRLNRLLRLGLRPLGVGLMAWMLVGGVALVGALALG